MQGLVRTSSYLLPKLRHALDAMTTRMVRRRPVTTNERRMKTIPGLRHTDRQTCDL